MKCFLLSSFLILSYVYCAEAQDNGPNTNEQLKKLTENKIIETDKKIQQKLKDFKSKQLQKVINFTPGFKTALKNFFAYDWQNAIENEDKKTVQAEVLKRTKRLQNDYNQLVTQEVIDALPQFGTYFSIQSINESNKKEFIEIIKSVKNTQDVLYKNILGYEKQAKNILSSLLSFADLTPSPYRVWYKINQSALEQHAIIEKFAEIIPPLLESNNSTKLENQLNNSKQTLSFLQKQWKAYTEKITILLANLRTNVQQGQNFKPLLDRIFTAKFNIEKLLSKLMSDVSAVNKYGSFIPAIYFVDQWMQLVINSQNLINQWDKANKEWKNKFNKIVERHQDVYEYLSERKIISEFPKVFFLEDDEMRKKNNALLTQALKILTTQKNELQTKKNMTQKLA